MSKRILLLLIGLTIGGGVFANHRANHNAADH